jgi:DNA invertase Pin-like site-specific DNA recombinase
VRQVLGAISEFDKAMTVAKLRGARERKRRAPSLSRPIAPSPAPPGLRAGADCRSQALARRRAVPVKDRYFCRVRRRQPSRSG